MNKIHRLEVTEPEVKVDEKKHVIILYIEADEDHVALQEKNSGKKGQRKIAMPSLVYIYKGIDPDRTSRTRARLKNVEYFGGIYEESEELWLEVI